LEQVLTPIELKEARISLGFTQEKLATELGVHRFTLLRWESGEHKVPRMLDLALKQLKREQRRLKARRRQAVLRKQVKLQTFRLSTEAKISSGSVECQTPQSSMNRRAITIRPGHPLGSTEASSPARSTTPPAPHGTTIFQNRTP